MASVLRLLSRYSMTHIYWGYTMKLIASGMKGRHTMATERYSHDDLPRPNLEELDAIQRQQDADIDFSDAPKLTAAQLASLRPAHFLNRELYKPIKKDVHIKLDADMLEWIKSAGEKGYQTRLYAVLRWAFEKGCPINRL